MIFTEDHPALVSRFIATSPSYQSDTCLTPGSPLLYSDIQPHWRTEMLLANRSSPIPPWCPHTNILLTVCLKSHVAIWNITSLTDNVYIIPVCDTSMPFLFRDIIQAGSRHCHGDTWTPGDPGHLRGPPGQWHTHDDTLIHCQYLVFS